MDPAQDVVATELASLERLVRRVARRQHAPPVECRVVVGNPTSASSTRRRDADPIVMATHGRTGLAHLLIGSVAEKVVRHSPVPVLTIRPTRRRRRPSAARTPDQERGGTSAAAKRCALQKRRAAAGLHGNDRVPEPRRRETRGMTAGRRWIVLAVLVASSALLVWWWTRAEPVAVALADRRARPHRAHRGEHARRHRRGLPRARLAPAVGGQIERLAVHEGDHVAAGPAAARAVERRPRRRSSRSTSASTGGARPRRRGLRPGRRRRARRRAAQALRTQGVASEENRNAASARRRRAAPPAARPRRRSRVAEARIDVARAALDRTRLRAPFAGVVAEVNGEVGEFVTPSPVGIPTPPTVDLIDDRRASTSSAPIDEVDAPRAARHAGAHHPRRLPGTQLRRARAPRRALRARPREAGAHRRRRGRLRRPGSTRDLLPGYSADVEIVLATRDDVAARARPRPCSKAIACSCSREDGGRSRSARVRSASRTGSSPRSPAASPPASASSLSVDREGVRRGRAGRRRGDRRRGDGAGG